jgi:hypothetical protein
MPYQARIYTVLLLAMAIAWSLAIARDAPAGAPQYLPIAARAEIGSRTIQLEVARTPSERALGLMLRPALEEDRGMLFPIDPPGPARMWMKNVPVALDLVFIHQGRVVDLTEQVPPCPDTPCPIYGPTDQAVDQVIELRAGRIAELGIRLGDEIRVTDLSP